MKKLMAFPISFTTYFNGRTEGNALTHHQQDPIPTPYTNIVSHRGFAYPGGRGFAGSRA